MTDDRIPERSLGVSTGSPTDMVRVVKGGVSMVVPADSLPVPAAATARLDALEAGQTAGMLGFETKSAMDADTTQDAGTLALVTNDSTASNNGTYRWSGSAWVQSADRVTGLEQETKRLDSESFRLLARLDGDWWTHSNQKPLGLYDLSYGAGVGYTIAGATISTIHELSGNGEALTPGTGQAAVGAINGLPAATIDGGATVKAYFGSNQAIAALFAAEPYTSFSIHHVTKLNTFASTCVPFSFTTGSGFNPGLWVNFATNGTMNHVIYSSSGGTDSIASGPAFSGLAAGGTMLESLYIEGSTGKATTFINGWINNLEASTTIAGHSYPLNLDTVNVGSLLPNSSSQVLDGQFGALAVFGANSHELGDAAAVHRGMLERWAPDEFEDIFTVFGYGQSNTAAVYTNPDPVVFDDGTARAWLPAAPTKFTTTSVGHATFGTNTAAVLWFAQEIQRITGDIAVIANSGSGGIPLIGGWLNASSTYLEPETEQGVLAGKTSNFKTNLSVRKSLAKLLDNTPRFRSERFRVLLWIGCETDVQSLIAQKVGSVVPADILQEGTAQVARGLSSMIDRFKSDLGFTHAALVLTGRRGGTLSEVQGNAPIVAAVNAGYRQVAAARSDTYIVYSHNIDYSTTSFALDDLVVDGDGAWVSGMGSVDGVHYTFDQYRAIGITGARNFLRQLGLY